MTMVEDKGTWGIFELRKWIEAEFERIDDRLANIESNILEIKKRLSNLEKKA